MPHEQTQQCPACKTPNRVCLDCDDIPGSEDRYRYVCPKCGNEIQFSPSAGTQREECPDDLPVAKRVL